MATLNVRLLHPSAKVPVRAHDSDIGYDLFSIETITIYPSQTIMVRTGIAVQCVWWASIEIWPRSGMASKGIMTIRDLLSPLSDPGAGLVDPGYTGEIRVVLHNLTDDSFQVYAGERIAQLKISPVMRPDIAVVDEFDETDRGDNGFGSTGE